MAINLSGLRESFIPKVFIAISAYNVPMSVVRSFPLLLIELLRATKEFPLSRY